MVLVCSELTLIVELVGLAVTGPSPYPSFKLMAYSAPLLTLLVLSARSQRPANLRPAGRNAGCYRTFNRRVLAMCFFLTSTSLAIFERIAGAAGNTDVSRRHVQRKRAPRER